MRRMNYGDILQSEIKTFDYSNSYLKGFALNAPKAMDALFQIIYFTGKGRDVKTLEGQHHSYCYYQYLQLPYSFRACFILYSFGYYKEACFILRHIVESLVRMKFLKNHKEYIEDVWKNKSVDILDDKGNKKRLTMRVMFEEVSPGYYDTNYGKLLSGTHHGGIASLLFRMDGNTKEGLNVKMGSNWDERMGTFVVNHFIALIYSCLINFSTFFPEGFLDIEANFAKLYKEIVEWLKAGMEDHKKKNSKSVSWYAEMEGLMLP